MLRLFVLILLVANIGFYSWTQGKLDNLVGMRAQGDREPERLLRQVNAETIRVAPPSETANVAAGDALTTPLACLEAGPYTAAQIGAAEGVLQTVLPAGSWVNVRNEPPTVWIVYMGKYSERDTLTKKADELRRLKVTFEELRSPPELQDGLALGRYDNRGNAEKALADLTQRGVRTARVVNLPQAAATHTLRVERADAATQSRLAGLRAESLAGHAFTACTARP